MSLPRLVGKTSSQKSNSSNGFSRPMLINCIHCEEEYTEKKEDEENDLLVDKLQGIQNIDKKDYRLCSDCVDSIISGLQQQITNFSQEITMLQEKKIMIMKLIEQSKERFEPNDFKLLQEAEPNLNKKIVDVEEQKKVLKLEIIKMQNEYYQTLKEENEIDDEILLLEKQTLDLIEQKEMQQRELQQVNDQIKQLENQSFLRDQFRIKYQPNLINGFLLTIPTKEFFLQKKKNYMEFNQGMGQLCLLFEYLKRQTKYEYQRINAFECNGAVSKVERSKGLSLDLYCKLSDQDTPHNKKGTYSRFHIPFEGIREFSYELIDFFSFILQQYQKQMNKNNVDTVLRDVFEKRVGELHSKQESKECWDFYFSQILHHFDCILDAFQSIE